MAATDVPLHLGLRGRVAGEFVARPGPRRLATIAVRWVIVNGGVAMALVGRHRAYGLAPPVAVQLQDTLV